MSSSPNIFKLWILILLAVIAFGIYSAVLAVTNREIYLASDVEWRLTIVTYVFFMVASTGLAIISAAGNVFKFKGYRVITERATFLAIITLITGFIPLMIHLGHPERMFNFLLSPNLGSSMWWMGFLYFFYLIFEIAEFYFLTIKRDAKMATITASIAVVAAVAAHFTLGSVFARLEARPLWYGAFMPFNFLLSALRNGVAIIIITTVVGYWLTRKAMGPELKHFIKHTMRLAFIFLLGYSVVYYSFVIVLSNLYVPAMAQWSILLFGHYSFGFWVYQILMGKLIPFIILLIPGFGRSFTGLTIASALFIMGNFVLRYQWTIAGQVTPIVSLTSTFNYYSPNMVQYSIIAGVFALFLLVYALGLKYLNIEDKVPSSE